MYLYTYNLVYLFIYLLIYQSNPCQTTHMHMYMSLSIDPFQAVPAVQVSSCRRGPEQLSFLLDPEPLLLTKGFATKPLKVQHLPQWIRQTSGPVVSSSLLGRHKSPTRS